MPHPKDTPSSFPDEGSQEEEEEEDNPPDLSQLTWHETFIVNHGHVSFNLGDNLIAPRADHR